MARRIFDIAVDAHPRAVDPDLSADLDGAAYPEPAPPMKGPNRLTFRVPSHGTKLSLGEGDLTDMAAWNKRPGVGTEAGIVAQTDLHAHLHTFGASKPDAKTLVRLGTPATSVPAATDDAPGADAGIASLFGEAQASWSGYAMLTQGAAYQESRQNHVIVSAEGEVRVVGDRRISLGTPGDVLIGADAEAESRELCPNEDDPTDPSGAGRSDAFFRVEGAAPLAGQAEQLVRSFVSLVGSIGKSITARPVIGGTGFTGAIRSAITDASASASMLFLNTGLIAAQLALPRSPGGQVSVFASRAATVSSPETVALHAGGAASMVAGLSASVLGGVAAHVSGLVSASLSGLSAAVSGQVSAVLEAVFGPAEVRSPAGVNVYSPAGPVTVTGGPAVQVTSATGGAVVHGAARTYIGAGSLVGTGLYAMPSSVFLGNLANAGVLAAPGPVVTAGISITPAAMSLAMSPTVIELTPRVAALAAPAVSVSGAASVNIASPATFVGGGAVYLG